MLCIPYKVYSFSWPGAIKIQSLGSYKMSERLLGAIMLLRTLLNNLLSRSRMPLTNQCVICMMFRYCSLPKNPSFCVLQLYSCNISY
ncbi:hypothetical protein FKM82_014511 [Ascaphus truei]